MKNNIFLAPLANINCYAFRKICQNYGAGQIYSPMITSKEIIYNKETIKKFDLNKRMKHFSIQIAGSELDEIKQSVKIVEKYCHDKSNYIDINAGCPDKHIIAMKSGAYLMKDLKLLDKKINAFTSSTNKPISIKIRTGWARNNLKKIMDIVTNHDISFVAIHGRTKKQMYSGKADWDTIKMIKETYDIPIIGNGDINSKEIAFERLKDVDGIMIGRYAMKNPMIFKEILKNKEFDRIKSTTKTMADFIRYFSKQYEQPLPQLKMHLMNFCHGFKGAKQKRIEIGKAKNYDEVINIINNFYL